MTPPAVVLAAVAGATWLLAGIAHAADPYLGEQTRTGAATHAAKAACDAAAAVAAAAPMALTDAGPLLAAAPSSSSRRSRPAVAPVPPLPAIAALPAVPRLPPDAWYGISLRCSDCSISRQDDDAAMQWSFGAEPEILDVEPDGPADRAGVRPGDVLTHVDGHDITSRLGGQRFGSASPGDTLRWTVRDGRKSREVTVVAQERPELEGRSWASVRDELRAAAEGLRSQNENLSAYLDAKRLAELRATQGKLEDMARKMADLDRRRSLLAPRAYVIDPDDVVVLPDDDPDKDPVRIVKRDRRVHRLRYTGDIGDSRVEVRGSSEVVVTEEKNGDIVIDTPDASIRVERKKR
jgi:hypothetical protein